MNGSNRSQIGNSTWLRALAAVGALALAGALFAPPPTNATPLVNAWTNWLHLPVFAAVYIALHLGLRIASRQASGIEWRPLALAAVLALLSEVLQPLFGRSIDLMDLLRDIAGIAAGWLVVGGATRLRITRIGRVLALTTVLVLVAAMSVPPLASWSAKLAAERRVPALFAGEPLERLRWELAEGVKWRALDPEPGDRRRRLALKFSGSGWPGATLHSPTADWTEFETLDFEIRTSGDTTTVGIRIDFDSEEHPRHHFSATAIPAWTPHSLPLAKMPSLAGISTLVFFVEGDGATHEIELRELQLR